MLLYLLCCGCVGVFGFVCGVTVLCVGVFVLCHCVMCVVVYGESFMLFDWMYVDLVGCMLLLFVSYWMCFVRFVFFSLCGCVYCV